MVQRQAPEAEPADAGGDSQAAGRRTVSGRVVKCRQHAGQTQHRPGIHPSTTGGCTSATVAWWCRVPAHDDGHAAVRPASAAESLPRIHAISAATSSAASPRQPGPSLPDAKPTAVPDDAGWSWIDDDAGAWRRGCFVSACVGLRMATSSCCWSEWPCSLSWILVPVPPRPGPRPASCSPVLSGCWPADASLDTWHRIINFICIHRQCRC